MVPETQDPDPIDVALLAKTFAGRASRHVAAVDDEFGAGDKAMRSGDLKKRARQGSGHSTECFRRTAGS
jgi:hypothetical protein